MIGALLCWLGLHKPWDDCEPKFAVYWACCRCGELVKGGIGKAARK